MNRKQAISLLTSMPQEQSDLNHYLETEVIMKALAKHFKEDEKYWGLVGLLHDIDWSLTKHDWTQHTIKAEKILKDFDEIFFDKKFIQIIQSHTYGNPEIPIFLDKKRTKRIEHCLIAAETITGIIYAYALMRNKKISNMKVKGLKKKFKDKSFANNCNRNSIKEIEKTGLELNEFFEISINAIKNIKEKINLN